jgi:hypothetical protein
MDAIERKTVFRRGAEAFFEGASFLAGVQNPTALLVLRLAAGASQLLLARADARLDAVLNAPIDVSNQGYDRPEPAAVLEQFSVAPRWPGVEVSFADEVARGDWRALQRIHRVLSDVLERDRPLLRALFAEELRTQRWRDIVDQWPLAQKAQAALTLDPRIFGPLERFARLLAGPGAAVDDAQAQARIAEHWSDLKAATLQVFR